MHQFRCIVEEPTKDFTATKKDHRRNSTSNYFRQPTGISPFAETAAVTIVVQEQNIAYVKILWNYRGYFLRLNDLTFLISSWISEETIGATSQMFNIKNQCLNRSLFKGYHSELQISVLKFYVTVAISPKTSAVLSWTLRGVDGQTSEKVN